MNTKETLRFTVNRDEYERASANGETVAYTAALHLPGTVRPLCEELRVVSSAVESVNILNPISSYRSLRVARQKFFALSPKYRDQLTDCLKRLAEPVEGATALDMAWIQGFTTANGISAFLELTSTFSSVSESLDRKAAYSLACFALYVSVISLTATVVFGWLSLR